VPRVYLSRSRQVISSADRRPRMNAPAMAHLPRVLWTVNIPKVAIAMAISSVNSDIGKRRLGRMAPQPPIGARGLAPQKICVQIIPIRCIATMLTTIDFAVAVPTPTGPPLAL
jgi:hypothetical protein